MLSDRIKELRKYLKCDTQRDFSNLVNFPISRIQDIERGKVKELKSKEIEHLQENFLISSWWLLTGKGQMLNNETNTEPPLNLISISYFKDTYAAAGAGALNYDEAPIVMAFEKEFLKAQLGLTTFKHLHIINAIGDSMYPTIQTGELLFVNPYENENCKIKDKDIYVVNTPGGVLVKRIKIENPIQREYTLVSDNPKDVDIPLKGDDLNSCQILGRVVGHFNKL